MRQKWEIGEVYLPYLFRIWHFQKCYFQKTFLIDFLDELGNFKQKKIIYTFNFYTFKNVTLLNYWKHCVAHPCCGWLKGGFRSVTLDIRLTFRSRSLDWFIKGFQDSTASLCKTLISGTWKVQCNNKAKIL